MLARPFAPALLHARPPGQPTVAGRLHFPPWLRSVRRQRRDLHGEQPSATRAQV